MNLLVNQEDNVFLTREVSEQEMELALSQSSSDKAQGPDGMNAGVIKALWEKLKMDLMDTINFFMDKGKLPQGMNSSFFSLIPKVKLPKVIKDFRPISLINCSLKILSKILTNRMLRLMDKLVSPNQTGFIKGRKISEGILITNEVVHSIKSEGVKGLILKLDFEKAFDSVDCEFLFEAMYGMGFSERWIFWIRSLFSSMRSSVLVNGSPTEEFRLERGLRQGDPLSPFLFNIVGEVFHLLMEKAKEAGLIEGIKLRNHMESISHLQFADDTIIFLNPELSHILNLKRLIQCFQLVSGLKINFGKSSLFGWKEPEFQSWSDILGCKVGELQIQYLGASIGTNPRKRVFWKPLLDKFDSKLANWKKNSLNQAVRRVLVKAYLNSLPIYCF